MSVLIKGFDKPKNCRVCDFNSSDCFCKINHGKIDRDFWDCDKPCPIIEIPTSVEVLSPYCSLVDAKIESMNMLAELTPDVTATALNEWYKELEREKEK